MRPRHLPALLARLVQPCRDRLPAARDLLPAGLRTQDTGTPGRSACRAPRTSTRRRDHGSTQGPGACAPGTRGIRTALAHALRRPGLRARTRSAGAAGADRLGGLRRGPQGAGDAPRRTGICGSGRRALGRAARREGGRRAGAVGLEGGAAARAALRRGAQRRHLPGRDLEDLPPRGLDARGARGAGHRGRLARPEPARLRVRPRDPSLQGLRVDGHAAVPWALQLLSEPRARAGRRLDERALPALRRRARHPRRRAGLQVPVAPAG